MNDDEKENKNGLTIHPIRDMERSLLVIEGLPVSEEEYILKMVQNQSVPGLLPLDTYCQDGHIQLRYDISACSCLSVRYEKKRIPGYEVRRVLTALRDVLHRLSERLLDSSDLLLRPEQIYYGPGGDEILLCFVPHLSDFEKDSCRSLAEFLIQRADHQDASARDLAYAFYDSVCKDCCILPDLLTRLLTGKLQPEEAFSSAAAAAGQNGAFSSVAAAAGQNGAFSSAAAAAGQNGAFSSVAAVPRRSFSNSAPVPAPTAPEETQPVVWMSSIGQASADGRADSTAAPSACPASGKSTIFPAQSPFSHTTGGASSAGASSGRTPGGVSPAGGSSGYTPSRTSPAHSFQSGFQKNTVDSAGQSGTVSRRTKSAPASRIAGGRGDVKKRTSGSSSEPSQTSTRKLIAVLGILAALVCLLCVLVFHIDAAQVGGFGFLSVAVIWLIAEQVRRSRGDIHNIWADEEDPTDDDAFYQALLREVYARDGVRQPSAGSPDDAAPVQQGDAGSRPGMQSPQPAWQDMRPSPAQGAGMQPPQSAWQDMRPSPAQGAGMQPPQSAWQDMRPSPAQGAGMQPPQSAWLASPWPAPQTDVEEASRYHCLISQLPQKYPDIPLLSDCIVIGTDPACCDFILPGDTISHVHARIDRRGDSYYVTDLFSTNGTRLNGQKLEANQCMALPPQANVSFADFQYKAAV